jgi:ferrous iron transport protein A
MLALDSQVPPTRPQQFPLFHPFPDARLLDQPRHRRRGPPGPRGRHRGDDAVALRLLEMGLTPGVAVTVLGRAPFGDPLELELRGYRLSIRLAEAARVTIERA